MEMNKIIDLIAFEAFTSQFKTQEQRALDYADFVKLKTYLNKGRVE